MVVITIKRGTNAYSIRLDNFRDFLPDRLYGHVDLEERFASMEFFPFFLYLLAGYHCDPDVSHHKKSLEPGKSFFHEIQSPLPVLGVRDPVSALPSISLLRPRHSLINLDSASNGRKIYLALQLTSRF
jgi:hypothetical protein